MVPHGLGNGGEGTNENTYLYGNLVFLPLLQTPMVILPPLFYLARCCLFSRKYADLQFLW